MSCRRSSFQRQRGAALVVALLVFALCSALIVAMQGEFSRFARRAANAMQSEQAMAYLRGAEDLASLVLLLDYDQDQQSGSPRDDLNDVWANSMTPYALDEGGWLEGSLEDLQGRFNLNLLAQRVAKGEGKPRFTAAQAQFIRLLQALDEPQLSEYEAILVTQSISDWLDADSIVDAEGAEDDFYSGSTPAYRTANGPMASVSELRAIAHVTPELYLALHPWVTVWPEIPSSLNIHTASATVLRSINVDSDLSPLSLEAAEALVEQRSGIGFTDIDDFMSNPVFGGTVEEMAAVKALLGESSSVFLLSAEVEVADRNLRLYSVLERRNRKISALARAGGSL